MASDIPTATQSNATNKCKLYAPKTTQEHDVTIPVLLCIINKHLLKNCMLLTPFLHNV